MNPPLKMVFSPEAEDHLIQLFNFIASNASPSIAHAYTSAIVERCEHLGDMPLQGIARDDIRPGLRTAFFRRRVVIAYAVDEARVTILAIFYGGQDYETLLRQD